MIKLFKAILVALGMMILIGVIADINYDFPVKASSASQPESSSIILPHELLDKKMAILVLGAIDYYVEHCTELTPLGVDYRNYIISYHDINVDLLPLHPGYIKGALSSSIYDCGEMYEIVVNLDNNKLVIRPTE